MLKYAKIAKVGQTIRAYDFKPMAGRDDCFVEGVVEKVDNRGYDCYVIRVTKDHFDNASSTTVASENNRVGQEVFVPFEVSFMEYDGRILNLSE